MMRAMIFANDLPRMIAFYSGIVGLAPVEESRMDTYLELQAGNSVLALHAIPAHLRCTLPDPAPPREQSPIKLSFAVDDVPAERGRLESMGVRIIDRPWGGVEAIDPEGNIFGLYAAA